MDLKKIAGAALQTQGHLLVRIAEQKNLAAFLRNLMPNLRNQMRKKVVTLYRPMQSSITDGNPSGSN
jgi:hypothetical protein